MGGVVFCATTTMINRSMRLCVHVVQKPGGSYSPAIIRSLCGYYSI